MYSSRGMPGLVQATAVVQGVWRQRLLCLEFFSCTKHPVDGWQSNTSFLCSFMGSCEQCAVYCSARHDTERHSAEHPAHIAVEEHALCATGSLTLPTTPHTSCVRILQRCCLLVLLFTHAYVAQEQELYDPFVVSSLNCLSGMIRVCQEWNSENLYGIVGLRATAVPGMVLLLLLSA